MEEEFFEKVSLQQIFAIGLKKHREKLKNEFTEQLKTSEVLDGLIDKVITPEHIDKMFYLLHGKQLMTYITKVKRLIKAPILYFSDDKTDEHLKYNLNNSMNIVNQSGVFTWNASPTKPIEHIAVGESEINANGKTVLFSKCININKKLVGYVRKRITELGITKKYIYPDAWKIAQQAYCKSK